jgi:DNA-binding winged helix-turn-helix (wHTH) protein/tetratricopeptide (TPR) repeat protein
LGRSGDNVIYVFGDFELDTGLYELRRAGAVQPLEPQVFDVLRYLVEHRDHLVSKDELLREIWPGRVVSESALTSRLKTARQAIGDTGRDQRWIKTSHGRGYRFVGEVDTRNTDRAAPKPELALPATASADIVGRDGELGTLRRHFERAAAGQPEVVFVEGEAGLGKTTLIHSFLDALHAGPNAAIAIGQCYERGTTGEAFMPLLDALGGLATGAERDSVVAALSETAPSWLMQMPWLVSASGHESLQRRVIGITRERMLREFAAAASALSAQRPLVIVLEDVHWSDASTLGLVNWLARRRERIRLLILATYRPGDAPGYSAELGETVYNLRLRGLATNLALSGLDASAIAAFLERQFPGCEFPPELERELEQRIDGSPLFLQSLVDAWRDRGLVHSIDGGWRTEADLSELLDVMPESLRRLISDQLAQLDPDERAMIEAASVTGVRFPSALVDAACGAERERDLARLAEHGRFLVREDDSRWPDGTLVSQFRFRHALFREVTYSGLPAGARAALHLAIAQRLERGYRRHAAERAAELAMHFTAGEDLAKAIEYRLASARQAFARGGYREAISQLEAGLAALELTGEIANRAELEIALLVLLAPALIQTNGWADARARAALERARAVAIEHGRPELPAILFSLAAVHELRGDYAGTEHLLQERRRLPSDFSDAVAELGARELLACSQFHQGSLQNALRNADAGLAIDSADGVDRAFYIYGENPRVSCHNWAGLSLALMGDIDRARERVERALSLSRAPIRSYSLSNALCQAATLRQLLDEPEAALSLSEEALSVAAIEGFTYPTAVAEVLRGWALAASGQQREGIAAIERGLELHTVSGAEMDRPYYLGLYAEALLGAGRNADALAAADRALEQVAHTRQFFFEADLLRIKASILLAEPTAGHVAQADALLEAAVAKAELQTNRLAELRARLALLDIAGAGAERSQRVADLRKMLQYFRSGLDLPHLRIAAERVA